MATTRTYPRSDPKTDRQLQLDVQAELNRDWRFSPAEIGVEVDQGVVTLRGTVSSYLKLGQAAEVATKVIGVHGVANELTVSGPFTLDDTRIAQLVRTALTMDLDVPEDRVHSVVRDGVITLTGIVDHWTQREAAYEAVTHLEGVRNVNNHIVVAPTIRSDQQLFEEIKASLARRLPFTDIDVSVDNLSVTLMGKVATYWSRHEAARIVSSTPGVKDLHNKLVVD